MRRARRFISALALLCVATPLGADPVADSISASIKSSLQANGIDPSGAIGTATINGASQAISSAAQAIVGSGTVYTWFPVIRYFLPEGSTIGGGSFGGGGATGSWTDSTACNFNFRLDPDGDLIVPAAQLKTGKGMTPSSSGAAGLRPGPISGQWSINGSVSSAWMADTAEALQLWYIHNTNLTFGTTLPYWLGVYKVTDNGGNPMYWFSRPSSYDNTGTKIPFTYRTQTFFNKAAYFGGAAYAGYQPSQPCPSATATGGNVDFYAYNNKPNYDDSWTGCVMYYPNPALSPSGYQYPSVAAWPVSEINNFPRGAPDSLKNCKLSPALIAAIAKAAWQKAASTSGYQGAQPPSSVDPKTGGTDPKIGDLDNDPRNPLPTGVTPTNPTPDPTTSPTPSPSPSIDMTDPGIGEPSLDVPGLPSITWFPTFSLDLGSPSCPTYSFDAFGHHYVLDSHCPLVEQFRSAIGVMMMLLFAIAAIKIVLKA